MLVLAIQVLSSSPPHLFAASTAVQVMVISHLDGCSISLPTALNSIDMDMQLLESAS